MKTHEEIKRGLDCCTKCVDFFDGCSQCPYNGEKLICYELQIDALAYIRQLEQRVPRWTSVKERLPEDDDHYLVWSSYNGCAEVAMYWGDGEWLTDDIVNITRMVTHWMPLPEPPEEDEHGKEDL